MLRKELNAIPGLRAVVQDLSQQGFTAQRGFPVEFSVRGPDWDKLVEVSQDVHARSSRASGTGGRPRHRLPARHAGAAHRARPRPRRRPRRLGRGRRARTSTRWSAACASASTAPAAAASTSACGCSPTSARGPRTSRSCSCAPRRRARAALVAGHARGAAGAAGDHPPRPRARHHHLRQRRARARSQDEALALRRAARARTCRSATALVLGGASVAFRESMASLALRAGRSASSSRTWCWPRSSTRSSTRSRCSRSCRSRSPARRSRCWLAGKTLNIFSMIGMLLLMGIVKKNSIILVDYANQLREDGTDAYEAHAARRPGAPAADPDDLDRHDDGRGPAGARARPRRGDPRPDGDRGDRRPDRSRPLLSLLVVPAFYVVADRLKNRLADARARRRAEPAAELR